MELIIEYLVYELEDDNTEYGGIDFIGETVRDFLEYAELSIFDTVEDLNIILKECGIKPIKTSA